MYAHIYIYVCVSVCVQTWIWLVTGYCCLSSDPTYWELNGITQLGNPSCGKGKSLVHGKVIDEFGIHIHIQVMFKDLFIRSEGEHVPNKMHNTCDLRFIPEGAGLWMRKKETCPNFHHLGMILPWSFSQRPRKAKLHSSSPQPAREAMRNPPSENGSMGISGS